MSRLTSATNPESGTVTYKYDENGNLTEKKDARNITTKYKYDVLNRNTEVDYSNTTAIDPDIKRQYDGATKGKGRPWGEYAGGYNPTDQEGEHNAIDSYDDLGRPLTTRQQFKVNGVWSAPYYVSQTYDIPGNVKTITYPSGHTVDYSYHQSGRLSGFSGKLGDGVNRNYATGMQYDPAGLIKREQFGTTIPLYLRRHYNNRLQMFDIRLGTDPNPLYDSDDLQDWQVAKGSWNRGALRLYYATLDEGEVYGNGGTDNNGNLLRMDFHIQVDETDAPTNFVMSIDKYTYDSLNRVKSVYERSFRKGPSGEEIYQDIFRQAFLYDQWGNRTIDQANTTGPVNKKAYAVQTATNRLEPPAGSGTMEMGYDAAGNLVRDSYTKPTLQAFDYDQENRMVEAKNGGVVVGQYTYDAGGKRTRRFAGEQETWYVYGGGGELVAEYIANGAVGSPQKEYGYRNGQLLVVWDSSETVNRQLQWLVQDHLGSTRMLVDRSGSLGGVRKQDFLPFGEQIGNDVGIRNASIGYGDNSVSQKFTGKRRDNETELDFFEARYFSSTQGRFTSPDEFKGGPRELFILGSGSPTKQALPYAEIINPQSLNKYQYCYNNPLRYVDPDGHKPDDGIWESIKSYLGSLFNNKVNWDWGKGEEESMPQVPNPAGVPDGDKLVEGHFNALQTTSGATSEVLALLDPTGGANIVKAALQGGKSDVVFAAAGSVTQVAGIKGFTKHGINQIIERAVKPAGILDAMKNPLKIGKVVYDDKGKPSQRIVGRMAEVVINPDTKVVVSANPTSSNKARKLLKQLEHKENK